MNTLHMSFFEWVGAALIALFMFWCLPTAMFLNPVAFKVHNSMSAAVPDNLKGKGPYVVEWVRTVPWGQVTANWPTEVRTSNTSCDVEGGTLPYEQRGDDGLDALFYVMDEELVDCISLTETYFVVQTHNAKMFGLIPRWPMETIWECDGLGIRCVK